MKKVLVLGGTRFFGKRLVKKLIDKGYDVTIATRGNVHDDFGDGIKRLIVDRTDHQRLAKAVGGNYYDVVYDQICYSPNDARAAVNIFQGKVGQYILMSSMAVYHGAEEAISENQFDPRTYSIQEGGRGDFEYGEGKRQAEAVFYQEANFSVTAVRFPVVLGLDDYTKRLEFHIERMQKEVEIGFLNLEAKTTFINSEEAAELLLWLADKKINQPLNACSNGSIRWRELFAILEKEIGKQAIVMTDAEAENTSPYSQSTSRYMDTARARKAGFEFSDLMSWIPDLVRKLV